MDDNCGTVRAFASSGELIASAPETAAFANIEPIQWASTNGWNMTRRMIRELAQLATHEPARPDVTGVVITHGTDTVEEQALVPEPSVRSIKPTGCSTAKGALAELG